MIVELPTEIALIISSILGPFSQNLRKTCNYFRNIIPYKDISREECLTELVRIEDISLIEKYRKSVSDDVFDAVLIWTAERPTLIDLYNVHIDPYICAFHGNLSLLKLVIGSSEIYKNPIIGAALGGSLECLEYLHGLGYSLRDSDLIFAIEGGDIECLKYLHNHGCELCEEVLEGAIGNGNIEIVKYLHEHDCPYDENPYIAAIYNENMNMIKCLHDLDYPFDEEVFCHAICSGIIEIVKYFHENKCPWDESAYIIAISREDMEMIKYLHGLGYPFPENALKEAVKCRNEEIIRYLLKYVFQDDNLCYEALRRGDVELMKHLHQLGYAVDISLFSVAIDLEDISLAMEAVRYLHDSGCPWSKSVFRKAVAMGRLKIVEYLYENGCPYDEDIVTVAVESERVDILKFFHRKGFHFDVASLIKKANDGNCRMSMRFLRRNLN